MLHACRAVNMVHGDGGITKTAAEYDQLKEKVMDITDLWVGAMRGGVLTLSRSNTFSCSNKHILLLKQTTQTLSCQLIIPSRERCVSELYRARPLLLLLCA
jgi:hypothetical protein